MQTPVHWDFINFGPFHCKEATLLHDNWKFELIDLTRIAICQTRLILSPDKKDIHLTRKPLGAYFLEFSAREVQISLSLVMAISRSRL